jgi:hypothetical protein
MTVEHTSRKTPNAWGRRLVILVPYVWLAAFSLN